MRTPQIDFSSINFAGLPNFYPNASDPGFEPRYEGPQFSVLQAVTGSLIAHNILDVGSPSPNASWAVSFTGPALTCNSVSEEIRSNISQQLLAAAVNDVCYGYLSWVPDSGPDGYLPLLPDFALRSGSVGPRDGVSPLQLYVLAAPNNCSAADPAIHVTQCTLYEASYGTSFQFVNGFQTVSTATTSTFKSKADEVVFLDHLGDGVIQPGERFSTNRSSIENLAYQAVFDAFGQMFIGGMANNYRSSSGFHTLVNTSMGTTPLMEAHELAFLPVFLSQFSILDVSSTFYEGLSVMPSFGQGGSMTRMMEDMFRNATVSLMTQPRNNPNYSSPFAPSDTSVEMSSVQNIYIYSAATLWAAYGIAIGAAALSCFAGIWVVVDRGVSYSNKFSTVLRLANNVKLSGEIDASDTTGQDPLPAHMANMTVVFPPDIVPSRPRRPLRKTARRW